MEDDASIKSLRYESLQLYVCFGNYLSYISPFCILIDIITVKKERKTKEKFVMHNRSIYLSSEYSITWLSRITQILKMTLSLTSYAFDYL